MNGNIFQYLEKTKGKPIPFEYKLLNKLPLTKNDLTYNHILELWGSNITYLPDNLTVNGGIYLYNSEITSLPNNLYVDGWLDIRYTKITELPDDLYVGGDLYCNSTPLEKRIKKDKSLLNKYSKQIKGKIYHEW